MLPIMVTASVLATGREDPTLLTLLARRTGKPASLGMRCVR